MTKKDYIKIADTIKSVLVTHDTRNHDNIIKLLALRLAKVFGEENPRFDREKFINYIYSK